jgi:thiamine biosynthesis protein ThiS
MKILLNNKEESFDGDKLSVTEIRQIKKFTYPKLIVKVNGRIIEEPDYNTTIVRDGDKVMILHLLAGG